MATLVYVNGATGGNQMNSRQPIEFQRAFENAEQVCELIRRREQERDPYSADRKKIFDAGKNLLDDINMRSMRSNLRDIYRWKLRAFEHRFKWVRDFPDGVSDVAPNDAIRAARKAVDNPFDEELVRAALVAFDKMKYVGVPVASAFL
jgi:hypothetical protein